MVRRRWAARSSLRARHDARRSRSVAGCLDSERLAGLRHDLTPRFAAGHRRDPERKSAGPTFDEEPAFLDRPDIPADNNGSERDLRILARHRKATGGTRSPWGSRTLGRWMSIRQTARKNGLPLRDFVIGLYDTYRRGKPPPSLFPD
jgi:transposase